MVKLTVNARSVIANTETSFVVVNSNFALVSDRDPSDASHSTATREGIDEADLPQSVIGHRAAGQRMHSPAHVTTHQSTDVHVQLPV